MRCRYELTPIVVRRMKEDDRTIASAILQADRSMDRVDVGCDAAVDRGITGQTTHTPAAAQCTFVSGPTAVHTVGFSGGGMS